MDAQHKRLALVRAIAEAGIPHVVWGEDALAFAHCVPTMLFALQILVPDRLVTTATSVITSRQTEFELEVAETPSPRWLEYSLAQARAGNYVHALPDSAYLFHPLHDNITESMAASDRVWSMEIHPQSAFQFDVEDLSCSRVLVPGLPPSNASVRFPTRGAFLDSLVASFIDNPMPYYHVKLHMRIKTYIQYLGVYTLGMEDCTIRDGSALCPEAEALLAELRPENRPFMRNYLMFGSGVKSLVSWREQRRMIMGAVNSVRSCLAVNGYDSQVIKL